MIPESLPKAISPKVPFCWWHWPTYLVSVDSISMCCLKIESEKTRKEEISTRDIHWNFKIQIETTTNTTLLNCETPWILLKHLGYINVYRTWSMLAPSKKIQAALQCYNLDAKNMYILCKRLSKCNITIFCLIFKSSL